MSILDSIKTVYQNRKDAVQAERDYVTNHKGTEAICAYMKMLFDKGNSGYNWLKENRSYPLYPKVDDCQVRLCYQYIKKDPQSFKEAMPKDEEIVRYNFRDMFEWYGLADGEGYNSLDTKLKKSTLEYLIENAVLELPHIKHTAVGFTVKMFQ